MMRVPPRVRLVMVFLAGLATGPAAFWAFMVRASAPPHASGKLKERAPEIPEVLALSAVQLGGLGVAPAAEEPTPPPTVVHVMPPVSAKAARTWEKLQASASLSFPNETPLEDVLKAVKKATKGANDKGVQFYVEPIGLQEAEKTMTSPLTIDLEDVSLTTLLRIALKQLGLKFYVQEDGIVVVTNEDDERVTDPLAKVLDELASLRAELSAFRHDMGLGKADPNHPPLAAQVARLRQEIAAIHKAIRTQNAAPRPETRPERK